MANTGNDTQPFDYSAAFSRNLGWVTEDEQHLLRQKRIAIAGLGGVGSAHLLALTRLGIGAFNLADLDVFEVVNFNRQLGATISCLGKHKVDVLAEMALDVNPQLSLRLFTNGINAENVDEFLRDADLYVDGLDFFVTDARETVFAACAERKIPAITAAPLGWGSAWLVFSPEGMTFEEYFRFSGQSYIEKLRRFLVGLSPTGMELAPLVDATRLDIDRQRGPSTSVGAFLCAGVTAASAAKLLLGRGEVPAVPRSLHFDAYSCRFEVQDRPKGVDDPEMQARLAALRARAGE